MISISSFLVLFDGPFWPQASNAAYLCNLVILTAIIVSNFFDAATQLVKIVRILEGIIVRKSVVFQTCASLEIC